MNSHMLKLSLIRKGIKQRKCECCNLKDWNDKPIPIELHHIDGNSKNNELDNLMILCPNCHAQTDNYKSRKRSVKKHDVEHGLLTSIMRNSFSISEALRKLGVYRSEFLRKKMKEMIANGEACFKVREKKAKKPKEKRVKKLYFCIDCGKEKNSKNGKRCVACYNTSQRRQARPPLNQLIEMIKKQGYRKTGEDFKVSDNSIRKWLRFYQVNPKDIKREVPRSAP